MKRWIVFNEIIGGKRFRRAQKNYHLNTNIGIRTADDPAAADIDCIERDSAEALLHSNIIDCCGHSLLTCQYGGNFPLMKFSKAKMSDVCCEILAAYNALRICGKADCFSDFFKLACEFEANGPFLIKSGHFGADYRKIGLCLEAHGLSVKAVKRLPELESIASSAVCCVISYRFSLVKIHTFLCIYDGGRFISVNRGSGCLYNWSDESLAKCLRGGRLLVGYAVMG